MFLLIIMLRAVRRLQPCTNTHVKHKTLFLLPMFIANSHDSSSFFWSKRQFSLHSWMLLLWCRYNSKTPLWILLFSVKITLKQKKYAYCNLVCHVLFLFFSCCLQYISQSFFFLLSIQFLLVISCYCTFANQGWLAACFDVNHYCKDSLLMVLSLSYGIKVGFLTQFRY